MRRRIRVAVVAVLMCVFTWDASFTDTGRNAIYYNQQGWYHLKRGDMFRAAFSFKNALNRNPKYLEAVLGLGRAYYELEAFEQAYDLYADALKMDSKSVEAHSGLGFVFTGMGDYTRALESFSRAEKISPENLTAKYGIANLYHEMGRDLWAKRKLNEVLRINPYHYDSLLLMGKIKSGENRMGEAEQYILKAIDSDDTSPVGFIRHGEVLLAEYMRNSSEASLERAVNALKKALAIQPESYMANRQMGFISYITGDYRSAVDYFTRSLNDFSGSTVLYCRAVANELAGNRDAALADFLRAMKRSPSDSILRARFENFLVLNDYKTGHPARVMFTDEYLDLARDSAKRNMPDETVLHLRRSLLMNPMNRESRERLMDYYSVLDYDRLYINELKELNRLFPAQNYRDRISVAVVRRRDRLYHREGFSREMPPRDVPAVLVLDFDSGGIIPAHPDAGKVIAGDIAFALGQFGRMSTPGIRSRAGIAAGLRTGPDFIENSLASLGERVRKGEIGKIDYIVYGSFREHHSMVRADCSILNFHKGYVISEFSISESGNGAIRKLSMRAARRIYGIIPYRGRILKVRDKGVVLNLGLADGVKPGERLVVFKKDTDRSLGIPVKIKLIFTVREADTYISYAEPQKPSVLDSIDSNDYLYPVRKRRAKRIE